MKPLANSVAPGLSRWSPTNIDTEMQAAAQSHAARSSTINEVFGVAQPFEAVFQGRGKSSKTSLALINAALQWIYLPKP